MLAGNLDPVSEGWLLAPVGPPGALTLCPPGLHLRAEQKACSQETRLWGLRRVPSGWVVSGPTAAAEISCGPGVGGGRRGVC